MSEAAVVGHPHELKGQGSGKIMRRILRRIAANDWANLGDVSTLADPAVVDGLIQGRAAR
jgi:acetyl-CoA synthetase